MTVTVVLYQRQSHRIRLKKDKLQEICDGSFHIVRVLFTQFQSSCNQFQPNQSIHDYFHQSPEGVNIVFG